MREAVGLLDRGLGGLVPVAPQQPILSAGSRLIVPRDAGDRPVSRVRTQRNGACEVQLEAVAVSLPLAPSPAEIERSQLVRVCPFRRKGGHIVVNLADLATTVACRISIVIADLAAPSSDLPPIVEATILANAEVAFDLVAGRADAPAAAATAPITASEAAGARAR